MSRLFGYGPGEILDRLTILDLKLRHAGERPKTHFLKEVQACLSALAGRNASLLHGDQHRQLAAINVEIWKLEDRMRELRAKYGDWRPLLDDHDGACVVADVAFQINAKNAARAALVDEINQSVGLLAGPEKLT